LNTTCEFPETNISDPEIKEILSTYKTIAVVGISDKTDRDSYKVARYLQDNGYKIIPINPRAEEVLGQKSYPNLKEVPDKIGIVNIFRKPEAVGPIVEEATKIGAKVIWMQLGIVNNEAARQAKAQGLKVVQNKCIKVEHNKVF